MISTKRCETLRAVRRLRPDSIPEDVLYRVLEAATWAPTGGNRQAWRIIVVKDPARKQRLGELYKQVTLPYTKSYMERLAGASEEERRRAERTIRASTYLAEHFGESPVLLVVCFNPEGLAVTDAKLDRQSVVGGGSIYPAVENLLLACRAEGSGVCADDAAVYGRTGSSQTLGDSRSVGNGGGRAYWLSRLARAWADLATASRRVGVYGCLGNPVFSGVAEASPSNLRL